MKALIYGLQKNFEKLQKSIYVGGGGRFVERGPY